MTPQIYQLMTNKLTIGILIGGRSVEHEVSILTGFQVLENIDRSKYNPLIVYLGRDNVWYTGSELGNISFFRAEHPQLDRLSRVLPAPDASRGKLQLIEANPGSLMRAKVKVIDCIIPATHGTFVEDGCLQGILEMAGVPFAGSGVTASAIGMDKLLTKALLAVGGFPHVHYKKITKSKWQTKNESLLAEIEDSLGYPVFVKPARLGSSVGINYAENREKLTEALEFAFRFGENALVEKAIVDGREINCSVLDGDPPLASVLEEPLSISDLLTYNEKYMGGIKGTKDVKGMAGQKRIIPAELDKETTAKIQDLSIRVFTASGAGGVARIDFLLDQNGEIYVNEINNIPGSLSSYLWEHMGKSFSELIDRMIQRAFEVNKLSHKFTYTFSTNLLSGGG